MFKAGASEVLSMYAVFEAFVLDVIAPRNILHRQRASLFQLFKVIDMLLKYRMGRREIMDDLHTAVQVYHHLYGAAYGHHAYKPKNHLSLHCIDMHILFDLMWFIGTLALERKQKAFKKFASQIENLDVFEGAVLADMLNHQVNSMHSEGKFLTGTYALNVREPSRRLRDLLPAGNWLSARRASHRQIHTSAGDVVLANLQGGPQVARIECHLCGDGVWYAMVRLYQNLRGQIWQLVGGLTLIELESVLGVCIWTQAGENLRVLPPRAF